MSSVIKLQDMRVRAKDAAKFLGVGQTKFYQLAKLPDFPKKVFIGETV